MALSSSAVGMRTVGRSDIFDMVFHPAITPPQAGHCTENCSEKECKKSELLALLSIAKTAILMLEMRPKTLKNTFQAASGPLFRRGKVLWNRFFKFFRGK